MHRQPTLLAALALGGLLAAPVALADHGGRHAGRYHHQPGVVIYPGGHGSYAGSIRPWQMQRHDGWRSHRYHAPSSWSRQAYRHGYRDGYRAGRHIPHRHHRLPHATPHRMRAPHRHR